MPARVRFTRAKIAVSINFDGATTPCASGASIGYPNDDSYDFAQRWKALYQDYFSYKWHEDNFTENLSDYYAYRWIPAEKFLLLELGEITAINRPHGSSPDSKKYPISLPTRSLQSLVKASKNLKSR